MVQRKVYTTENGWVTQEPRRRFNEATASWDRMNQRVVFGRDTVGPDDPQPPVVVDETSRRAQFTAWALANDPRGWITTTSDWVGIKDASLLRAGPNPGGTWTITTPGTYDNYDFTCNIRVTTTGLVTIRNFRMRGYKKTWTSQSAWIVNASGGVMNLVLEDGEINPDYPTPWANGYSGPDCLMRRVIIRRTTDGIGQFTRNGDNRFRMEACLVEKLSYFTPDPPNSNRPNTHNDCCQVFQGSGIALLGSRLNCSVSLDSGTPPYGVGTGSGANRSYPAANGQAVGLTPSLTNPITGVTVKYCAMDYGEAGISVVKLGSQTTTNHDFSFNRFGPHMGTVNSGRPVPMQFSQGLVIPGFDCTTLGWKTDTRGNVWEATGDPVQYLVRTF